MKLTIGIDPDVEKSGVAVKYTDGRWEFSNLGFFQLFDYLQTDKANIKEVVVEAGWLIKHNWHARKAGSAAINANIGNDAGRNHEVGRKIVEMCTYLELPCVLRKPLKKIWKGPDGKITHDEFVKVFELALKRSNQEMRDAALLIL